MHAFSSPRFALVTIATMAAALSACSSESSMTPTGSPGAVTLSIASRPATAASASLGSTGAAFDAASAPTSLLVVKGADTLQLDTVAVVFARVVLRKSTDLSCGDAAHDDAADHDCAELKSGPILVSLPLTPGASTLFSVTAPAGTYTGLTLSTHKPKRSDSGPNVQEFLAQHPEYENTSIRVVGKFRGVPFAWRGDPEAKLDESFVPPLTVSGSAGLNVTLRVDVASWFAGANGALLDPRTTSYPQIAENIKHSFAAFEDQSHSGNDDHAAGTRP
jgi:hypothetical protein